MSKRIYLFCAAAVLAALGVYYYMNRHMGSVRKLEIAKKEVRQLAAKEQIREGDIIFQTSQSSQSKAIQLATHSKYSHCGIIFKDSAGFYVLEAVQPVKHTALDKWIAKGLDGRYVIKRLKNASQELNNDVIANMTIVGYLFTGSSYDTYFGWSDDKMYCSELVWKIYQRGAGLEVGKLQKLKDFDLTSEPVKRKMKERYGNHIPLNETVISPVSIFDSELLETVTEN